MSKGGGERQRERETNPETDSATENTRVVEGGEGRSETGDGDGGGHL